MHVEGVVGRMLAMLEEKQRTGELRLRSQPNLSRELGKLDIATAGLVH